MNRSFDELSRNAAAGTLTEAERAVLDAHLRAHPADRALLEWDEAFTARLAEKVGAMPAMPGWERTALALDAEARAAEPAPGRRPSVARPRILDRLSAWLESSLGVAVNAQAVALGLVVLQAGVIGVFGWQFGRTDDDSQVRAGMPGATLRGPLLRVSFRADLREAELRRALAAVGGEIVGGPGQIGIYLVRIPEGDLATAAQRLRDSGTTDLVEIAGTKP